MNKIDVILKINIVSYLQLKCIVNYDLKKFQNYYQIHEFNQKLSLGFLRARKI